ncbi:MAG TPA: XTP/dITP diphosphatase [Thermodesulfovibrionales bacterium]|nr:XTP/dITP diphosphatase [Thermodesulfovibrionales bacterium]
MKELVIATRNRKKIEEMKRLLEDMAVLLYTLDDFPGCPEVSEDADSFRGNAVKKASAVANYAKRPAISDDSGLEVFALNGAPGVFSARYAGEAADDKKNLEKLLSELHDVDDGRRGARFVCCIALAFPDGSAEAFEGSVEGRIGRVALGSNGFGYDPVFYPEGHERTFAEMAADEKDALSHRGKALRKFREYVAAHLLE